MALAGAAWFSVSILAFGWDLHVHFLAEVLPQFSSGEYNGLAVKISDLVNAAPASLFDTLFPNDGRGLSGTARLLTTAFGLSAISWTAWSFRHPGADVAQEAARVSAVAVLLLLVPVFTYEHHLVWAMPALAVSSAGVLQGRLSRRWVPAVGFAWAGLAFYVSLLYPIHATVAQPLAYVVAEMKLIAILTVWAGCVVCGRGPGRVHEQKHQQNG